MAKVFVLFTGDHEQRGIHSLHSSREEAVIVDSRVRKGWSTEADEPDIEEREIDPRLCQVCGYSEELHIKHPDTWTHPFAFSSPEQQGEGK